VVKKDALGKGNLDGVLATDTERQRLDRDLTAEEKAKLPSGLQQVRAQYDQARATQALQQRTGSTAVLRRYAGTLEELEKQLTKRGDIDGAIATRRERAAVTDALAKLTARPDAAADAKTAPPAPSAPPATPPRPVAATTLSGSKPASTAGTAPVLNVCPDLSATARVETQLENVVSFIPPLGGPVNNRGGRGVMLKNDPATGAAGTTWAFELKYRVPHGGVQIVHPFGTGHIVIHLRDDGLFVIPPGDVAKEPWQGGDRKKINLARGKGLFPLLAGTHQLRITSQLKANGKYTLSVGGAEFGTATFAAGQELVLDEAYKAEKQAELPLHWPPGSAGLIGGGTGAGGVCQCLSVTFQASAR
jgi:hypothetical protein